MKVDQRHSATTCLTFLLLLCLTCNSGCQSKADAKNLSGKTETATHAPEKKLTNLSEKQVNKKVETASFGAGCFWCVEAVFQELDGVISVKPGYMGGVTENPTYQDVCGGNTGHAEICQITFDPDKITFKELLEVFWKTHDPTRMNRQGADRGTQYRSVIFYHSDKQKQLAVTYKNNLNEQKAFPRASRHGDHQGDNVLSSRKVPRKLL